MKRLALVVLALVLAALAAQPAAAQLPPWKPSYATDVELGRVASIFAMRKVEIQCPTAYEWAGDPIGFWGAIGYTSVKLRWNFAVLGWWEDASLCDAARAVASGGAGYSDYHLALAVTVLVHESYHLRRWRWAEDEGRVECQAIRHFVVGVQLLGGSRELALRLRPWALLEYWRIATLAPQYYWPDCKVPSP